MLIILLQEVERANAVTGPGGYLQWLETDTRLWKAYPSTVEISQALSVINKERQHRDLAPL